jgi:hypothetical protein
MYRRSFSLLFNPSNIGRPDPIAALLLSGFLVAPMVGCDPAPTCQEAQNCPIAPRDGGAGNGAAGQGGAGGIGGNAGSMEGGGVDGGADASGSGGAAGVGGASAGGAAGSSGSAGSDGSAGSPDGGQEASSVETGTDAGVEADAEVPRVVYVATLTASNAVPPTSSLGMGTAELSAPANTLYPVEYTITVDAASFDPAKITGLDFRRGNVGSAGTLLETVPFTGIPSKGTTVLDGTVLSTGTVSLNIRTMNYPNGEIRGWFTKK